MPTTQPLHTLRSEFSTYLCLAPRAGTLTHLPAHRLAGHSLLCTTALPSQDLLLLTPGQPPVPYPTKLPLTHLPTGKILLGQDGAQLTTRPNGETAFQETPAGLAGEFFREPVAETLASAARRDPKTFRNAVFTAAGDRSNIHTWLAGDEPRDFALITAYYGAADAEFRRLRAMSDIALRATGGKFQILKTLLIRQPGLFQNYDFILLADDDLIWSTAAISRSFALAAAFDLWLCQPAFDPSGRVSFAITQKFPGPHTLRYVNFVETTCPLFRADKLFTFMNEFDGSLTGYGADFWFCAALGGGLNMKFAILDAVTVINPHESTKPGGGREIETLRPIEQRIEDWQAASRAYNIRRIRPRILGTATLDQAALAAAAAEA